MMTSAGPSGLVIRNACAVGYGERGGDPQGMEESAGRYSVGFNYHGTGSSTRQAR